MPMKGKSRSKRACRKHKRQVRDDSIPVDEPKNEQVRVVATTSVNNNSNLGNNDLSHNWSKRWTLNISFPTLGESSEQLIRQPSVSSTGFSDISFSENRNGYRACTCSLPLPIAGFDNSTFNVVENATYCPRINLKVLPKIFQLLDIKDLKSCRIVNSAWNKIASDELGSRHDCPVSFGYCLDQKCYYSKFLSDDVAQICSDFEIHGWNSGSNSLNKILSTKVTLRDLCNCLHLTSLKTNFPWTYFEFTDGIIDRCTDAREFFSMYGSRIRKLSVNFSRVTLPNLHKLFFFMAPKVEYLKLEKLVCIGNAAQADAYHHQSQSQQSPACHRLSHFSHPLPMLKILELGSDGRMIAVDWILRAIVVAANNLEEIKNASLDHLDVIVQSNKVHCVKSFCIHLNLSLFKYEWILQKFVNFHLNLHRLVITVDQKWRGERQAYTSAGDSLIPMIFPKVINKILRSCPETLETLTLMPLGNFSALEYPVLGKVKKLTLQAYNFVRKCEKEHWRNQMYFPEWLDFTKRFPNLRQLTVSLITWELNFNQDYGKLSCLPSVQRLSIINYFDSNSKIIPIFAELFPNLKQLTMKFDFLKLNVQCLDLIWKSWSKLEELNFEFVGTTQSLYCGGSPLDLIFTGLDERSYELLKRDTFGEFTRDQIVRIYPSISNMTYLRSFSMKFSRYFDDEDDYLRDSGSDLITLPLSIISVLYDFKWLPHLSLRMTFDEYPDECRGLMDALKTLAPYMAIEFNTDFVRDIEISPTHCSFCEVAEANHQWFEAHGYD